jgi:hypothetical protein
MVQTMAGRFDAAVPALRFDGDFAPLLIDDVLILGETPNSPICSSSRAGPTAGASSPARNGRIPARNWGSTTSTELACLRTLSARRRLRRGAPPNIGLRQGSVR